jgi:hypothetical protein
MTRRHYQFLAAVGIDELLIATLVGPTAALAFLVLAAFVAITAPALMEGRA